MSDYNKPTLTHTLSINNQNIEMFSNCRVSFTAPYNKLDVSVSTDIALSYYEARMTLKDADYDIGVGDLVYSTAPNGLAAGSPHTYSITFSDAINIMKNNGDGDYRLAFYGKSGVDGSWDATYLVFTISDGYLKTSDGKDIVVLTTQDIPS